MLADNLCTVCDGPVHRRGDVGRLPEVCSVACGRVRKTRLERERRTARRRAAAVSEHIAWLTEMLAAGDLAVREVVEDLV